MSVFISDDSHTTVQEITPFIGRTISEIHTSESSLIIKFTDGASLTVGMFYYFLSIDGCEPIPDEGSTWRHHL